MAYDGCVFVHEDFVSAYRWANMKETSWWFQTFVMFTSTCKDDPIWWAYFLHGWLSWSKECQKNYELSFGQNIATSHQMVVGKGNPLISGYENPSRWNITIGPDITKWYPALKPTAILPLKIHETGRWFISFRGPWPIFRGRRSLWECYLLELWVDPPKSRRIKEATYDFSKHGKLLQAFWS